LKNFTNITLVKPLKDNDIFVIETKNFQIK